MFSNSIIFKLCYFSSYVSIPKLLGSIKNTLKSTESGKKFKAQNFQIFLLILPKNFTVASNWEVQFKSN